MVRPATHTRCCSPLLASVSHRCVIARYSVLRKHTRLLYPARSWLQIERLYNGWSVVKVKVAQLPEMWEFVQDHFFAVGRTEHITGSCCSVISSREISTSEKSGRKLKTPFFCPSQTTVALILVQCVSDFIVLLYLFLFCCCGVVFITFIVQYYAVICFSSHMIVRVPGLALSCFCPSNHIESV